MRAVETGEGSDGFVMVLLVSDAKKTLMDEGTGLYLEMTRVVRIHVQLEFVLLHCIRVLI